MQVNMNFCQHLERNSPSICRNEYISKSAGSNETSLELNPLKPNNLKKRRTAQLTPRCCILYVYSTNIRTEYFKRAA